MRNELTYDAMAAAASPAGLIDDLDDLGKQAAQVQARLDQLVARLEPIVIEGPRPAFIDEDPAALTMAQHRVRAIAITLNQVDAGLGFLLDGIRL